MAMSVKILASGFAMGESPRWHEGQLWFSDWGVQEIVQLRADGKRMQTIPVPFALPFCFDWLADGRFVVVAGQEARVACRHTEAAWMTLADLGSISAAPWNEIVVDWRGNAYVNNSEAIALIAPDGSVRKVADGGLFPNGMAIPADNGMLLMAESHGRCITAFEIDPDGSLSNRRLWAAVEGPPDGICLDASGALWYADVRNARCVRIREGGEVLETVALDCGCFSCVLGGEDGHTLFVVTTEWRGMDKVAEVIAERTGQVIAVRIETPACPRPHRA
jgi:sugar lactone lactonase YvrE